MTKLVTLLSMLLSFNQSALAAPFNFDFPKAIYGNDDRVEVEDYADQEYIDKARSVALLVSAKLLTTNREDSTLLDFPKITLDQRVPLICPTEKFTSQISLGECSGFLIAPNKIVTAGHCMQNASACDKKKWVFDYKQGSASIAKNNVYSCKRIITQKYSYDEDEVNDYAVVELDRNVTNRAPLVRRKLGRVLINTPLVVIGHPMGLPMKITDGGKVSRMNQSELDRKWHSLFLRENYFMANLDAYAGNSGSPVFNKKTGKVEGILIQGAEDFVFNEETQCLESLRLSDSHLESFEKVMRITKIPGI